MIQVNTLLFFELASLGHKRKLKKRSKTRYTAKHEYKEVGGRANLASLWSLANKEKK